MDTEMFYQMDINNSARKQMISESDFDKYVDRYDRWYDRNRSAYLSEVEAIKQLLPKNGLGLEIGVGTGRFASILRIPFGVDRAKRGLKIAHTRKVEVTLASGEKLPFKHQVFDYVLMVIALSFFQNPKQALYEAKRTLKPNGQIIIGIVEKNSFLGQRYQMKKEEGRPFFREVIAFLSTQEVIDLLNECSFKNFKIRQTLFNLPQNLANVQQSTKGHGKGGFVVVAAEK